MFTVKFNVAVKVQDKNHYCIIFYFFWEECQSVHSTIVCSEGGTISHGQVPDTMKSEARLSSEPKWQNISSLKMDNPSNYVPCVLDVDIEKGKAEIIKSKEDSAGNLKSDDPLASEWHREICLQSGGKFMELLMKHGPELLKFSSRDKVIPERVYDTSANRSRKYKRSHSFNSRRVVLLFSVLSSMGTIILIYLTLRVRQIAADGSSSTNV
ncbi:hypothetical protein ACJIZ3_009736 [Penstemon smallii]|uniref:Uncharacterized protein n=1 Tax=Penstemon smallii TaxID=265156 RepID=A0ABD3TEV3_9LAMI